MNISMVGTREATGVPSFRVDGQVAVVTGAARGLGRAISVALASAGADVVLAMRNGASAPDLVAEIESMGRRVMPVEIDVTRTDRLPGVVQRVVDSFGRIDILVNNAGGGSPMPAVEVTESLYDWTVDVNLKSMFFMSQSVGRVMIRQGSGRIINLSSQAQFVALPTEAIYCAAKAAVSHLTKCLAVEWGSSGVAVTAVAPTFIRTPGTEAALSDDGFRAEVIERIAALHRIGEPMDVAGVVVFLASPAASMITGTTILVDGGWTAR